MSRTKVGRSSNTINVIDKYLRKKERKKESHTCVFVCSSKTAPRTHHGQHTAHSTQQAAHDTQHTMTVVHVLTSPSPILDVQAA